MATFDEREQSFEKKFAHEQERKFLRKARRDKLVAGWAAEKLGVTGAAAARYVRDICQAEVSAKGEEDVVRKLHTDFQENGLVVSEGEIRQKMTELLAVAAEQIDRGA